MTAFVICVGSSLLSKTVDVTTIENNTTDDTIEKPDLFQIKEKID